MNNNIFKISDERTTRFLASALMMCTGLFAICLILNEMGIFVIDSKAFAIVSISCGIIFCIPKAALIILKRYEEWVKYSVIVCATLAICIAYSVLTYHMVMMFAFPLIISVMYFDPKLTLFTTIETAILMSAAHILSIFLSVMDDDPLESVKAIFLYGLLPRLFIFCTFAVICIVLGIITQKLFNRLNASNAEIERSKESLNTIINVSRSIYGATDMIELASLIRYAVYTVTTKLQGDTSAPVTVVGVRAEDGAFHYLDNDLNTGVNLIGSGSIDINLPNVKFSFPVERQKVWDDIQIKSDGIGMSFYESGELLFYISMEFPVDSEDELLKNSLDILYNNVNIALKQTKMNSDIFKTQESIILSFAEISESKSRQTGQHVKRVSEYVKIMAAYAGYTEKECGEIALAAMMHDIGKLMIPPEILEKPSRLTAEEFAVIKSHVTYGEELLRNSPGEVMTMARQIALQHHERWDGRGYLGYEGENIDYISRLVAVADVFDALVSKRSYKDGWPPEEAYAEIVKQSGAQFAPHAVDVFVKSYEKILEVLKKYPDEVAQTA